jgi:hypothetical protein
LPAPRNAFCKMMTGRSSDERGASLMWFRALALLAALLMGTPGLTAPDWGEGIWVRLCTGGHADRWILLSPGPDQDGSPLGPCHSTSGIVAERRQALRRQA